MLLGRLYARSAKKFRDRPHGATICDGSWVWAMKHCTRATQCDAQARSTAFAQLSSERHQERLDFRPPDVRTHRLRIDCGESALVATRHVCMISDCDIGGNQCTTRISNGSSHRATLGPTRVRALHHGVHEDRDSDDERDVSPIEGP